MHASEPFIVGDLSAPLDVRSVRYIEDGDQIETVREGEVVSRWGWYMERGNGCIDPSELELLRRQGDPLSDAVVRFFELKAGQDGLARLEKYIEQTPEDERDPDISAFWKEVARDPPEGVSALTAQTHPEHSQGAADVTEHQGFGNGHLNGHATTHVDGSASTKSEMNDVIRDKCSNEATSPARTAHLKHEYTPERTMKERNRRPRPTLAEGQAVFWRYSGDIFHSLLHFSLAGGFSSARIMSVLRETGYLTSPSRDATYRRLMETTQALVDFMSDMTPITGRGWKSAIRVRLLHSQVRVRILDGKSKLKQYSVEKDGIPVNQEDLVATLSGFCLAPLWCQRRLGISLTPQEEFASIAAWRHVGYYMGVSPATLSKFYDTSAHLNNPSASHRFFACVAFHLFSAREKPSDPYTTATYNILHAVAHRPPSNLSTLYHCELSRFLLGDGLADQLAIPRGSWKERLMVKQHSWNSWVTATFSKHYFARWERSRQILFRRIITLIVAWQLGERRSHFTWRNEEDHAKKVSELQEQNQGKEYELGEEPGMQMGIKVGKEVRWQARLLFGEMGLVLASMGIVSALTVYKGARFVWDLCWHL